MDAITKVALSIVTVALVATLVVNYKGTSSVITSATNGFANSLKAAEAG
jgi:hypothetical protein